MHSLHFSLVEPMGEPPQVREAAFIGEHPDEIQGNAFMLEELLHLTRREQHPCPTLNKEQDACTLHFLGKGMDTTHGMACVQLNALNWHPLSCRFVMHKFQKIF